MILHSVYRIWIVIASESLRRPSTNLKGTPSCGKSVTSHHQRPVFDPNIHCFIEEKRNTTDTFVCFCRSSKLDNVFPYSSVSYKPTDVFFIQRVGRFIYIGDGFISLFHMGIISVWILTMPLLFLSKYKTDPLENRRCKLRNSRARVEISSWE